MEEAFSGQLTQEELDALPGGKTVATKPAATKRVATKPAATKRVATKSAATKSATATKPATATEQLPDATKPATATEQLPDATKPTATKSAATKKTVATKPGTRTKSKSSKLARFKAKRLASSDDMFAPAEDVDDKLNVLWYGKQGSTKTTCAATAANCAPEGSRVLVINAEGGLKVKALQKQQVQTSKLMVVPNPATDDVLDEEMLESIYTRVQADLLEDPKSWFAVVFDSASEVNDLLTELEQEDRVKRLIAQGRRDVNKNFTDRADYGVSGKIMRKWFRRFRDLPCHFLVTALLRRDQDDDTGKVAYGPAVSPGVANNLLALVDIAILTQDASGSLPIRGRTKNGGKYAAKDRFNMLPEVMVYPTFDRILSYHNGEETEATDAFQSLLTEPATPKRTKTARGGKVSTASGRRTK